MRRPESELIGCSYKNITVAEDLEKSSKMLLNIIDKAAPTRMSKRYARPDGSVVKAHLIVSKFEDDGRLVSTLSWVEPGAKAPSPIRLWEAALHIKHIYNMRIGELGFDLFGDNVGLILVDAYLAEAEGRIVSLTEIAASADLSERSALRWIKALEQRGLIHILDLAQGLFQLSEGGAAKMERLLTAAIEPKAF